MTASVARALVACACGVACLGSAVTASAQAPAPLLAVGVDVHSASLTQARYELFVANRGNARASDVVLTSNVPANTTFSSSDRAPAAGPCVAGAAAGTTCRWDVGDLDPGATATVTVTYALSQSASGYTVSSQASAQTGGAAPGGSDPSNTDTSLVRTIYQLDPDAHIDTSQPNANFGACDQLRIRRDGAMSAFLDNDTLKSPETSANAPERMWAASLEMTVASLSPPGAAIPVGAHRVITPDWDEGSGGCSGAAGTDRQVRAATRPDSEATATATASLSAPGPVSLDVTAALDTRLERFSFQGFELRAQNTGGLSTPLDTVALHSSEAATTTERPRLVTVKTNRENARCIDADAETASGPSDRPRRIEAYVTDGPGRVASSGNDACPGSPIAGAAVGWELDDDSPDAYFSSLAGVSQAPTTLGPADAGPDVGSTRADALGRTFAEISRARPHETATDVENRIAAIAVNEDPNGSSDPDRTQDDPPLEPEDQCGSAAGPVPCSTVGVTGESIMEDDVKHTWSAPLDPPSSGGGGTTPGGDGTNPAGDGDGAAPAARSIALAAPAGTAPVGQIVTLAGRLTSPSASCAGPREFVQILRRPRGSTDLTDFASVSTEPDGSFELPVVVDMGGDYVARAPAGTACAGASSPMVEVLARARIRLRGGFSKLRAGQRPRVYGSVVPALKSTVVLERRSGRAWKRVARQRLGRRGAFSFPLRAGWSGRRTFRVRWLSPNAAYVDTASGPIKLTSRAAR